MCHTLTGVWVEICEFLRNSPCHKVTPSRVCELKLNRDNDVSFSRRHTLTGVWVEIRLPWLLWSPSSVTPSRVCELKFLRAARSKLGKMSHPHGCVSWNVSIRWKSTSKRVTPSRVCELKCRRRLMSWKPRSHTLTGVWVEICGIYPCKSVYGRHTLTGVWVEIYSNVICSLMGLGHTLTGVWVEIWYLCIKFWLWRHTLTGVWVEIYYLL